MSEERRLNTTQETKCDDWVGNNAAFTCDACGKVFILSGVLHQKGRACPSCGKSKGFVSGGRSSGGKAWITRTE